VFTVNKRHKLSFILLGFFLVGCTSDPHVEDWKRDRITEIPIEPMQVSVCFDMTEHSKAQVYELAREECRTRISEVENLKLLQQLQNTGSISQAEGQAFEGPIMRQKHIAAMIKTLSLKYVDNDKWYCPLMTPNKISFECAYNDKARDSNKNKQSITDPLMSPDLPPELPDDLKPQ
jgi:hypothetical protein